MALLAVSYFPDEEIQKQLEVNSDGWQWIVRETNRQTYRHVEFQD